MLHLLPGPPGFNCWISLLWYSVVCTVEFLSLFNSFVMLKTRYKSKSFRFFSTYFLYCSRKSDYISGFSHLTLYSNADQSLAQLFA